MVDELDARLILDLLHNGRKNVFLVKKLCYKNICQLNAFFKLIHEKMGKALLQMLADGRVIAHQIADF